MKGQKTMNKEKTFNKTWIVFIVLCLLMVQFFYVLGKYEVIESEKVFWWTIIYFSPPLLVVSVLLSNRFTNLLFYPKLGLKPTFISKTTHLKNRLTSIGLSLLMSGFFTYSTIIQTNDWFGTDKYEAVIAEVLDVEYSRTSRYTSIRKGHEKWIISIEYKGEIRKLTMREHWQIGDTFDMTVNTGGCWNILFVG